MPSGGCWLLLSFVVRHTLLFFVIEGSGVEKIYLVSDCGVLFFFPPPFLGKSYYVLKHFASVSLFFGVQSISLHPTNPLRIESNCGGKSRGCFKEKNNLLFFLYNCRLLPFSFFFNLFLFTFFSLSHSNLGSKEGT